MSQKEHPKLAQVIEHLTRFVQERGPTTSPVLTQELATRFPELTLYDLGFRSLDGLLVQRSALSILEIVEGRWPLWGARVDDDDPGVSAVFDQRTGKLAPVQEFVRLERARFQGYRSLLEVELALSPLTLLVGANGSGKSNLLDGLFRVTRLSRFKPDGIFSGAHAGVRLYTRGQPGQIRCELHGSDGYHLRWDWSEAHRHHVSVSPLDGRMLGPARLLKLDPQQVARPSYSSRQTPYVDSRGHHVPDVLATIAATEPERLSAIQESVRQVIPIVSSLRMPRALAFHEITERYTVDGRPAERITRTEVMGNALEAKVSGQWIPADQLSEGTLLVIALQTILHGPDRPRLLLLDDLDRGLHPTAQRRLIRQLAQATKTSDLTVVASTHSPFVLDEVDPEQVQVVRLNERGHTTIAPLTRAPAWQEWKGSMTAGKFWIYAGEDWLERP